MLSRGGAGADGGEGLTLRNNCHSDACCYSRVGCRRPMVNNGGLCMVVVSGSRAAPGRPPYPVPHICLKGQNKAAKNNLSVDDEERASGPAVSLRDGFFSSLKESLGPPPVVNYQVL